MPLAKIHVVEGRYNKDFGSPKCPALSRRP